MSKRLIAIDGHIGSGALEVGKRVARMFDLVYFDRIALPSMHSKGFSVVGADDLDEVVEGYKSGSDRVWSWIERAASYFAMGAAGDDPMLQGAAGLHEPLTWDRNGPRVSSRDSSGCYTLDQVVDSGNAVIVHRAGSVALPSDNDGVARVGLFASWDDRVERVMHREGLVDYLDAERMISDREAAQREYFNKMHGADPEDPDIYDFVIDTSGKKMSLAALEISRHLEDSMELVAV